uniref:protein-tyrosine-phosphatase n=1 Tax=Astyanax mexicanus TaxID=7994 RepID=A0A8B9HDP9_ASTMX
MFRCRVNLLDDTRIERDLEKNAVGQVLFDEVCDHLNLLERGYFGLATFDASNNRVWLDFSREVHKQIIGHDATFTFSVKFYPPDPSLLAEDLTRYLLCQQVRADIMTNRLPCPSDMLAVLGSYVVQSELGDYDPALHVPGYLLTIPLRGCLTVFLCVCFRGLSQSEAELCYLNTARTLDLYGVELHSARDANNPSLWVGIASGGVAMFCNLVCSSFFPWINVIKISFKRKRFFIHLRRKHGEVGQQVVSVSMPNSRACKNLWRSCVDHHTFYNRKSAQAVSKTRYNTNIPDRLLNLKSVPLYRKIIGDVMWNPVIKAVSTEHLETKSLPSRSPPSTPNWRSPRMRHDFRSPQPSSVDNLTNEMSYVTESEDVFYTYRPPLFSAALSSSITVWQLGYDTSAHRCLVLSDITFWSDVGREHHLPTDGKLHEQDSNRRSPDHSASICLLDHKKYYFIYNNLVSARNYKVSDGELLLVRISPDQDGKFGFNVKGGVDQKMPLAISHVNPNSPAGRCVPALLEGDQVLLINGRDISEHTHQQVVMFIKASRESHSKELALLVRRKGGLNLQEEMPPPPSHPSGESLEESMARLEKGLSSGTLLMQFEKLYRKKPGLAMSCAKQSENLDKNRYKDVLPYDITRVVLQAEEDNYINASHVKTEPAGGVLHYVAAQGPLPHTCTHFWRSVWEQGATVIIMLTTLTERGRTKCHQYWPHPPEVKDYGYLQVCCHSEECNLAYVTRELTLTHTQLGQQRSITHLQYVAWPDHGVPEDSSDFLDFVQAMRSKRMDTEPLVVHCSAGIGRTGVLITMETALILMENTKPVYPLEILTSLREQRAMMVQTSVHTHTPVHTYIHICTVVFKIIKPRLQ